jgi:hypothetical protein
MKKTQFQKLKRKANKLASKNAALESRARQAEDRAARAEELADYYEKRFLAFGSNVETVSEDTDAVKVLAWNLEPQVWGQYCAINPMLEMTGDIYEKTKTRLVESIVRGLLEKNLVQFIVKNPYESFGSFSVYSTVGAKMYVVPWEQTPHEKTLRVEQFVHETLSRSEEVKPDEGKGLLPTGPTGKK